MYRRIKISHVLASVMAMILCLPSPVWADDGRYDNDGHHGGSGWNGHYEGHHGNHAPDHRYYNRGYHTDYYPALLSTNSRHAEHALRKNSTITTTITTIGGTFGNEKSRVSKPDNCINTSAFFKKTALFIDSGVCGDSTA